MIWVTSATYIRTLSDGGGGGNGGGGGTHSACVRIQCESVFVLIYTLCLYFITHTVNSHDMTSCSALIDTFEVCTDLHAGIDCGQIYPKTFCGFCPKE